MNPPRSSGWHTLVSLTLVIGAIITLIALGFWQSQRLIWKNTLIDQRQQAQAMEPLIGADAVNLDIHQGYRVTVDGILAADHTQILQLRSHDGHAGVNILTPLLLDDGSALIVNRGWVALADLQNFQEKHQDQPITIKGYIRPSDNDRAWMTPDNVRPSTQATPLWFSTSIPALAEHLNIALKPWYIQQHCDDDATCQHGLLHRTISLPPLVNNHLSYAIIWFSLALALIVIASLRWLQTRR